MFSTSTQNWYRFRSQTLGPSPARGLAAKAASWALPQSLPLPACCASPAAGPRALPHSLLLPPAGSSLECSSGDSSWQYTARILCAHSSTCCAAEAARSPSGNDSTQCPLRLRGVEVTDHECIAEQCSRERHTRRGKS